MWNIFIVDQVHLRKIVSKTYEDGDASVMLLYGMPRQFLMMMNLVIVTDRYEENTMTIIKNRWQDSNLPWTMNGTHSLDHLNDLINYVQEREKNYAKFT